MTDKVSGEWNKGIFGALWEKFNRRGVTFNAWIVCDGPVDALWIENLNTVLDDNRLLTLANGGEEASRVNFVRILWGAVSATSFTGVCLGPASFGSADRFPMTENVKLVFEVADVRNASPATVSRVGVVFVADTDLDWMVLVDSFVLGFQNHFAQLIRRLFMDVVAGDDSAYMGANASKDSGSWYGLRRGG